MSYIRASDNNLENFRPYHHFNRFNDVFPNSLINRPCYRNISSFKLDMKEHDNYYTLKADLPGLDKSNIKITLDNGLLKITANRSETIDETNDPSHIHISERSYGSFSRSINIPENVDVNNIMANYIDGVLDIKLQKNTSLPNARTISIQ